ncbi:DUF4097 family beta strand repeat-containing protein [Streptomyces sp. NBC_01235]|uniref:DUF4097 family beta strand repeat-containing protein n=1 Tax=Streptomyces sp. NBC_01235 TaxID=2903788 RepID=UPI002E0E290F|nr:DUF4097 domain-containing protein [Streptomyces sp. NBC_01235]
MAMYDTPEPISVRIEIGSGDVQLIAGKRVDTVVEIRPGNDAVAADVRAAEQTRVDFSRGKLLVKGPSPRRNSGATPSGGSIDVSVELPAGSQLRGTIAWGTLRSTGLLGECRFNVAEGDIRLDRTGPVRLATSRGEITVAGIEGHAKIANGSGAIRADEIHGTAEIGNDMGETWVGEITGSAKLTGMTGDFQVDRAHDGVQVKTAHGTVRLAEVRRGSVQVTAASAEIEIGIREGSAAKLDISTVAGSVHSRLEEVAGPADSDDVVQVRARTFDGDIVVRRAW